MRILIVTLAFAAVAGCASTGGRTMYSEEFAELKAQCDARDGILTPIPGAMSSRPQSDYACEIRGVSGRLGGEIGDRPGD